MMLFRYIVRVSILRANSNEKFSRIVVTYAANDAMARLQVIEFVAKDYSLRPALYLFRITSVCREILSNSYSS